MKRVILATLLLASLVGAKDFDRAVSNKSGLEWKGNELSPDMNINFIKQAAMAKAKHGKQSAGIYTKNGSQVVGSTILNNSKVQNVYNYSEIKGPVTNVNNKNK